MSTRQEDFVTDLFVANTHTPVLFFSTKGKVYKQKVYRLPEGSPTSIGKAMINILPLEQGETITTVMRLPDSEAECESKYVMFATASGGVRRNKLSDFVDVKANGKIAMKLDEGDSLIGVVVCDETQDILLAAKDGKCIRFPVSAIRVFASRNSTGVRGAKLAKGDEIISMSVLKHAKADIELRDAYLKESLNRRRMAGLSEADDKIETEGTSATATTSISEEDFAKMQADEEFLLTVTDAGFGKRSSAYEYRITNRGGSGVTNIDLAKKKGSKVVATFPVTDTAHILMVTDAGQLIRMPVKDVRIAGRNTMGVIMFRIADDEKVVSAIAVEDDDEEEGENTLQQEPLQEGDNTPAQADSLSGKATESKPKSQEDAE
jgi:DNA gyrase subunit A